MPKPQGHRAQHWLHKGKDKRIQITKYSRKKAGSAINVLFTKCRSGWDGILSGLVKSIKSAIIVEYLIYEESYSTVRIQKKERGKTNAYSSITFRSFNSFLNRVSKLDTTTTLTATLLTELGVAIHCRNLVVNIVCDARQRIIVN